MASQRGGAGLMRGVVIRIDCKHVDGADYPLFLANVSDPRLCHLNGYEWTAAISRLPVLRYDFFGGDFNGQISAPQAQFQVSPYEIEGFYSRAYSGARVRVWSGEVGDDWGGFTLRYDGILTGNPQVAGGIASFSAVPDDRWLDTPLLDAYAGTGGIEGPDDQTGIPKPLALGNVEFADGRLIDATNLIYQVNDGPVEAINGVYDRVASLGTSTGDYAGLAALIAASIPAGGWGTCEALGLVRLGAPPDGRVAFDVSGDNAGGYVRKAGAIIGRIASIAGGTTDSANLSALDIDRPYNLQLDILAQTTARQVIQPVADSVCAVAGVGWTGKLFVQPLSINPAPSVTLATDGSSDLAVADVSELARSAPFWRLATEAEPTYVIYDIGEVATGYNIRGTYSSDREYRIDDLVFADDGRAFVYVNATPDSGNAPPALPDTSNSYWEEHSPATVGAPSGTTVAGRDADDVASTIADGGGVADDQVDTPSIVANAVSDTGFAFTAGGTLLPNTGLINLQSLSVTADGVTPVTVQAALAFYWDNDNARAEWAIYRDSTELVAFDPITINNNENPTASGFYSDVPPAGTYTYHIKGQANDHLQVGAKNCGLGQVELKR